MVLSMVPVTGTANQVTDFIHLERVTNDSSSYSSSAFFNIAQAIHELLGWGNRVSWLITHSLAMVLALIPTMGRMAPVNYRRCSRLKLTKIAAVFSRTLLNLFIRCCHWVKVSLKHLSWFAFANGDVESEFAFTLSILLFPFACCGATRSQLIDTSFMAC